MRTRVPLAAGTVLGRYRILRLAGEGGMGDVYEAFDDSLERTVALKRVRGGPAEDNRLERFRREALALAQLNHPGICQVFELAQTDRGAFIAMEWVEGRTLSDRLLDGPLPWREAAAVVRQVAEALAAAHAKGIVHRDLKPGNVMLTPGGQAKVLDFGLARFAESPEEPPPTTGETPRLETPLNLDPTLDPGDAETLAAPPRPSGPQSPRSGSGRSLTLVGSFMGTLGYTSPEQALARSVGPPTDVFNLGILAQELVTAQRPFPGQGRDALDAVVDGHRLPLPRHLAPKGYRALVDRLLAPKPQDRPSAEDAAAAFATLVAPKGALWWTGVGAASVAVLTFGGYWLFGRGVLAGLVKGRPARVAVMGFRNDTGLSMLNAQTELGLADLLGSRLRSEPTLELLDPDQLSRAAAALRINPAEASPADQQRLARAVGADLVLTGSVDRQQGNDRLSYRLLDASGRVRASGEALAPSIANLNLAAEPLVRTAAKALREDVNPLGHAAPGQIYSVPPEAFAAYAKGVGAYRKGRYLEADPLLAQAAYAVPEWADAVTTYGYNLSKEARPEADPVLRWALVAARKEGIPQRINGIILFLGIQADGRRDPASAEACFKEALASAVERHDASAQALCLNGLGRVAEYRGETDGAARDYEAALDAAHQAGDQITRCQILINLGNLALQKGDLEGAGARYREVVAVARKAGAETSESLGLNNLGITLCSQFKLQEARAVLRQALDLREKNGDAFGVVSALRNLGGVALTAGDPEEARAWLGRSLEKAQAIHQPYGIGQAEFYLAECDLRQGRLEQALAGFRAARAASAQARDTKRISLSWAGEAACLLRLRRPAGAALAAASDAGAGQPYLLRAQALAALQAGQAALAHRLVQEALADPRHDAPELRPDLERLQGTFDLR
ncbi:MAG TPA: serine/threonine-protein kinase [Holophagaceae bacterium]|nr:serine/threonine-protein kinase [Holophagaceae bacterium]